MTVAQLTEIIRTGAYPKKVSFSQKNRINMLYEEGKTWTAINKLKAILEEPLNDADKTLL